MADVELLRTQDRLVQEIPPAVHHGFAILTLEGEAARNRQEWVAGCFFDLAPQFVGAQNQGHIFLAFSNRLADDSTLAVR